MTAAATRRTGPVGILACQQDPERWFDRAHRTFTLAKCLECPLRRGCARQALKHRPSHGMWAGIWIDGRLEAVSGYLRAIAESAQPVEATGASAPVVDLTPPPLSVRPDPPLERMLPDVVAAQRGSLGAQVLARASGHCEIMAPGCRLSGDGYSYRTPETLPGTAVDATQVYLRCDQCAQTVSGIDTSIARRLGYVVSEQRRTDVPFFWRQSRWVCFTADGRLHDADAEAVA